ncbi:MAG: cupin domain-containing protein [Thalassobaculales bacterium]
MTEIRPDAIGTSQVDNDRVRVTEWRLPPRAHTGWHRHEYDYVVVPLAGGPLKIESAGGLGDAEMVTGRSYFRQAGVEHDVINDSPGEIVFIEVEFKTPVPA